MAEEPQSTAKQGGEVSSVNLDNFLPPVKGEKAAKLNSPRSLIIVNRLGYHLRELYPIHPKKLWMKGVDNKETHRMKWDNWEQKVRIYE